MRKNITNKKLTKIFKNEGSRGLNERLIWWDDIKLRKKVNSLLEYVDKKLQSLDYDDFTIKYFGVYEQTIRKTWSKEDRNFVGNLYRDYLNKKYCTDDLYDIISYFNAGKAYYDGEILKVAV